MASMVLTLKVCIVFFFSPSWHLFALVWPPAVSYTSEMLYIEIVTAAIEVLLLLEMKRTIAISAAPWAGEHCLRIEPLLGDAVGRGWRAERALLPWEGPCQCWSRELWPCTGTSCHPNITRLQGDFPSQELHLQPLLSSSQGSYCLGLGKQNHSMPLQSCQLLCCLATSVSGLMSPGHVVAKNSWSTGDYE